MKKKMNWILTAAVLLGACSGESTLVGTAGPAAGPSYASTSDGITTFEVQAGTIGPNGEILNGSETYSYFDYDSKMIFPKDANGQLTAPFEVKWTTEVISMGMSVPYNGGFVAVELVDAYGQRHHLDNVEGDWTRKTFDVPQGSTIRVAAYPGESAQFNYWAYNGNTTWYTRSLQMSATDFFAEFQMSSGGSGGGGGTGGGDDGCIICE